MHQMTFWWSDKIEDLVVKGVSAEDTLGVILLCLALIGLCLVYEAIKFHQARIRLATLRDRFKMIACQPPNESATLLTAEELSQKRLHMAQQQAAVASSSTSPGQPPPPPRVVFHDPAPKQRCIQLGKETLIFFIQAVLGYFLMLAVMSYNGPIFIAIVFGMALGYFLFGHFTMALNCESQQLHHTTFKCSTNCPNGESMPPAFVTNPSSAIPGPIGPITDENQNLSTVLALKKMHSVAEGIVDQVAVTRQLPPPTERLPTAGAEKSHGCCNA